MFRDQKLHILTLRDTKLHIVIEGEKEKEERERGKRKRKEKEKRERGKRKRKEKEEREIERGKSCYLITESCFGVILHIIAYCILHAMNLIFQKASL